MAETDLRSECEGCGAAIRTANLALAGKSVKCPKCGEPVRFPAVEDDEEEAAPVKRRKTDAVEDDEPPRRAKSKSAPVVDEEDEDEEVRPKRKGKKPAPAKSNAMWLYLGGGVAAVAVVVVLILVLTGGKKADTATGPNGSGGNNSPAIIPKAEITITPDLFKRDYPPGDTSLDKYDGKVVEVEGLFRFVAFGGFVYDNQQRMYVTADYTPNAGQLVCRFPNGIDLNTYCPGQKVKVIGTFRKETNRISQKIEAFVNDCVIASTDGAMCPTRTAEELAAELVAEGNVSISRRKKSPKWTSENRNAYFYLTGKVAKIGLPPENGLQFATPNGAIEVQIQGGTDTPLAGVLVGSEVKLLVDRMTDFGTVKLPAFVGQIVSRK